MPQELLNHRQRHPAFQGLRGKGMPQDVGVDPPFQPGPLPDSCQGFLNTSRRQRGPWRSDRREKRVSALPLTQVFPQKWGSSSPQNAPDMAPGNGESRYIFARVTNYDAQNVLQEYWSLNQGAQNQARRICRNGVWGPLEWINPPMKLGVEYRTVESYNNKPVYAKAISFGQAPNATYKDVSHGIESFGQLVSYTGMMGGANLIETPALDSIQINASNIRITTNSDVSASYVYLVLRYTKTTD